MWSFIGILSIIFYMSTWRNNSVRSNIGWNPATRNTFFISLVHLLTSCYWNLTTTTKVFPDSIGTRYIFFLDSSSSFLTSIHQFPPSPLVPQKPLSLSLLVTLILHSLPQSLSSSLSCTTVTPSPRPLCHHQQPFCFALPLSHPSFLVFYLPHHVLPYIYCCVLVQYV